ncbi:MAG: SGNH/GDSL hydrolase family protein [Rhizobacter sp.]|nr:SGNH/GDSL hydrolase family protein [Bacteriovorax sp.]
MIFLNFFLLSLNLHAAFTITTTSQLSSRTTTHYPATHASLYAAEYEKWHKEINPFITKPYMNLSDFTYSNKDGSTVFDVYYHTGELGLRVVPGVKPDLPKHLIVAGDSNTFGVGCNDDQTLPYYLSKKFPDRTVYNFGLGGAGTNSTLRFLEVFKVKNIAPLNYKDGALILDFHSFYIQRIIGSKSFLAWSPASPQYKLNDDDIPEYMGPFTDSWQLKFYHFLDLFPYSEKLFPDLPQISEEHIELTARIIYEVKKKYLAQTSPENKFIVFFNPEKKSELEEKVDKKIYEKLKKLNIDVEMFDEKEILPLRHFELEGHYMPEGHKNYAEMIYKKIKDKI